MKPQIVGFPGQTYSRPDLCKPVWFNGTRDTLSFTLFDKMEAFSAPHIDFYRKR